MPRQLIQLTLLFLLLLTAPVAMSFDLAEETFQLKPGQQLVL